MPNAILGKVCACCKTTKPFCEYWKNSRTSDGLQWHCKMCGKQKAAKWRKTEAYRVHIEKSSARRKRGKLRRRFGITDQEYQSMLEEQGHACAVCRTTKPTGRWNTFCVDHDHQTGQVRGILCPNCNKALGLAGDDMEGVMRLVGYLTNASNHMAGKQLRLV